MLTITRFVSAFIIIICFAVTEIIVGLFSFTNSKYILLFQTRITSFYCRLLIRALNIKIQTENFASADSVRNFLLISNHLSYIDIIVLSSIKPALFISSLDVRNTFFIGLMAKLGGTIFVNRKNKARLKDEISEISKLLNKGHNIVLFPEGTTSDGSVVLPFKSPLIKALESASADILPVCIQYIEIEGNRLSEKNKDLIFWYGDMQFFSHFFKLLSLKSIKVSIKCLAQVPAGNFVSRKETASYAHKIISDNYIFI
jgi:1-acyl-sn-glycerol-3-phosphate acyltransferase